MSLTQNAKLKMQNNNAKRKTACFKLLVIALSFALYAFSFNKSAADFSLGISPPIIEIQVEPPAIIDTPITLQNHGNQTVTLKILFKPFATGKEENGEVLYLTGYSPLIFEGMKVIEDEEAIEKIIISPKQTKTLNLHLDIPKDQTQSDYYFSVIFVSENTLEERLNQLKIQGGIAVNVLLSVKGNPPLIGAKTTGIGKIVEFSSPSYLENGPVPFTIRLKNQSNHFIKPHGAISIKNVFGKTIGLVKLPSINILANTTRLHDSSWKEDLLFGPYTATLAINMSDKEPTLVKSIHFFVFPFRPFIILAILVFGVFFIKSRINKYQNR